MSPVSRSVYVSRLRRAFLLRVHPDRFRMKSPELRTKQAALVKALSERMEQPDFQAYQRAEDHLSQKSLYLTDRKQSYEYLLEKRDGTTIRTTISLQQPVEHILISMTKALQESGVASLPKPPKIERDTQAKIHFAKSPNEQATGIDHRYDKVSIKGRNLFGFLDELDYQEITKRKAERMNAQAAALGVRRLYQFSAVDATSLGWSSASVAILLRRMMDMHHEHGHKFHVESFYPLRLVFSSDDFHDPLDTYGGMLRLNPASTTVQWIDSLQLITQDTLEEIRFRSERILEMNRDLQGALGVKLKKGHSCSNDEYYRYLEYLHENLPPMVSFDSTIVTDAISLEPIQVTIEAPQSYRRPKVGKAGSVLVAAGTSAVDFHSAILRLSSRAREQMNEEREEKELCKVAIRQMQWSFGLHKVFRTGIVSQSEFLVCMSRILRIDEKERQYLQHRLSGNSLGVAGKGHFCHLSDDGSFVIPQDWS